MRLVRLVVAGVVLGAVAGFVAALLRPRTVHQAPGANLPGDLAPLPERADDDGVPVPAAAGVGR